MILYILAIFVSAIYAQYPPQWGSISCDTSITDYFPPGDKYANYNRYYTFTAQYATPIRRRVRVSTCVEDSPISVTALIEGDDRNEGRAKFRDTTNPSNIRNSDQILDCVLGETGSTYVMNDVPEGDWEIGIYTQDTHGGKYKLSVECIEGVKATPAEFKNTNVTQTFPQRTEWMNKGSKKISCGVSAWGKIDSVDDDDYYQLTITDYAQEIIFTTCTPETAQDITGYEPDGTTLNGDYTLKYYYWDFENRNSGGWLTKQMSYSPNCKTLTIGDAYINDDDDPTEYTVNINQLSPGTYYIGIDRTGNAPNDQYYVLSMMCWDNDAVANAVAGTNYDTATWSPTQNPTTAAPTTASPTTNNPQTPSPTTYPTVTFSGVYNKLKKIMDMGEISCGIHQHDTLGKKKSNYYMFQVTQSNTQVYFDTCMNDLTKFDAVVKLWEYKVNSNHFDVLKTYTGYCNIVNKILPANIYYIEIYGSDKKEEFGEYILRMGCGYGQEDQVTAVSVTDAPTPAPTGVSDIPAKDGRVVGEIMCGVTIEGSTSSQRGDFHKFTVISPGIDWVKFDTCDATSFKNYLFLYDYWNQTGHEQWQPGKFGSGYGAGGSLGFHYEDDTTCNKLIMNDLVPGVYYINIDGYNYYFDYGEYTIKMTCSDNSAVRSTSKFTEYGTGLEWWAILLIVLAVLICCGCIIFAVCYMKKKNDGGSDSSGTEMGQTNAGE